MNYFHLAFSPVDESLYSVLSEEGFRTTSPKRHIEMFGEKIWVVLLDALFTRGRTELSICNFKIIIPDIGISSAYIGLFGLKMAAIGSLRLWKLKRIRTLENNSPPTLTDYCLVLAPLSLLNLGRP